MKALKLCVSGLLVCVFLTGCVSSVDVFGLNVENFIEYEKRGTVQIPDEVSTAFYFKQSDAYVEAGKPGDESWFIMKNLADETEVVICEGNLGNEIRHVIVDEENQRLFYTLCNWRQELGKIYLITYDLAAMREASSTPLFQESMAGVMIGLSLDEARSKMLFEVYENNWPDFNGSWKYLSFDLGTEITEVIAQGISNTEHYAQSSSRGISKELFDVPFYDGPWDFHNVYYKTKYAGVYVNDGTNNIRVSANRNELGRPFWLEDEACVISGSYLYDTSGKMHERKIADGEVLAIY